jgi:hypothetical protein
MRGYAFSTMENLDRGRRSPHLHFLLGQAIRNAIETLIDLDVIIDIDGRVRPDRKIEAFARQGAHRRPIHLQKQAVPGPLPFLEGVLIEFLQEFADTLVEFSYGEEVAMPESRQDPALGD